MKQNDRYYKFWNKMMARCEKKGKRMDSFYMRQIKRSYKCGMISQEQFKELEGRYWTLAYKSLGGMMC